MAVIQKSLRIPEEILKEIEQIAEATQRDFSSVAKELLEEAVKIHRCPGIVFTEGVRGRRARVAGTGIEVWEIVATYHGVGRNLGHLRRAYHWLTDQQLIDAIAIGQVTPGPVFTTATFVGYILGGTPGALLATLGIFLPSFIFVVLSNPWIPKIRNSSWVSGLLDGVNVASLGLIAAVTLELGRVSLIDPLTIFIALASMVFLVRFRISSTWLIAGGAIIGLIRAALT